MKNLLFAALTLGLVLFSITSCSDDTLDSKELETSPLAPDVHYHDGKVCDVDHYMQELLSDPDYKAEYEARMQTYQKFAASVGFEKQLCGSPVVIPVAVHFQGTNGTNIGCLTTLVQQQMTVLNNDFNGTNSDITNWTGNASSTFPGINFGETCVEFVLANTNHPSGYGLADGDLAITLNTTSGDSDSNWSGYLNIFVKNAGGALGYSPLGGSGNGDGVVIDLGAFGTGTTCGNVSAGSPFDLGRTLVHEVGHYLLLDHIWGGGCNQDDGIADTPDQQADNGGCPNIGASSCGSPDLHMNYMDYTNDACMYMFTSGQSTVMENYVSANLGNITGNASNVINGTGGGSGGGGGGSATCDKPSATSTQVLSSTSAKVTWTAMPQASNYQLRYRQLGTTSWTNALTTISEKTITGLTASTTYQYRIRTKCPSGWSGFTAIETFTTSTGSGGGGGGGSTSCDKPGSSSTEYISATKTKVYWEAMPQAIKYIIRYRKVGTNAWTTKSSTVANKTLSALQNGSTYEYKIRTKCPSGWTGFTALETFAQSNSGGGGGGNSNNTLVFELTLDDYGSETSWELVDDNNNIVESGGPFADGNSGQIESETFDIPDGCYTLYVDDSYGDGICCQYGNGSFQLLDNNGAQVGYSNGNFGFYDYIEFCVTNNIVTFQREEKDDKATHLMPKVMATGSKN